MSWATIRDAIKVVIEATGGISGGAGKVVGHLPRIEDAEELLSFFGNVAKTKINGWSITREAILSTQEDVRGKRRLKTHTAVVRGYFNLKEADITEDDFQILVDAVVDAFEDSTTIWAKQPEREVITIAGTIGHVMIASHLVHFAEIRFGVDEIRKVA